MAARAAFSSITSQSESGGRDYYPSGKPVVSPKGARYAMQVMPSTARKPGFGLKPANPNDPADMNRLGVEYQNKMLERYGNDPAKMWGAYNAGPGRMDQALQTPDWYRSLPYETQQYIARNMRALGGY